MDCIPVGPQCQLNLDICIEFRTADLPEGYVLDLTRMAVDDMIIHRESNDLRQVTSAQEPIQKCVYLQSFVAKLPVEHVLEHTVEVRNDEFSLSLMWNMTR